MSTRIEQPTIVKGKLVFALRAGCDLDIVLRRAVRAVGSFRGDLFVPEGKHERAFLEGRASGDRVTLVHPQFTAQAGYENSWLSVSVDSYKPRPIGVVFLGVHMGRPGEQIDLEWTIGLETMPRLVKELNPTLAFMTAHLVDTERKVFPPEQPIHGSPFPRLFTPWTYFDGEKLTEGLRRKLVALPAAVSAPLERGWVVQAVDHVAVEPPPKFLAALRTLAAESIEYRCPSLAEDE